MTDKRDAPVREPRPVPHVGMTVEGTDIDGDGSVEMVTTTTVRAEQFTFPSTGVAGERHGVRTTEVEVSELDTDGDGRPDVRGVTVTEWLEADLDGDGDLDLVRVSERSALDHDGDGRADFITDQAREDVAVDTTGDGRRDTVVTTTGGRVEEPTSGQPTLTVLDGGRAGAGGAVGVHGQNVRADRRGRTTVRADAPSR